MDEDAILWPWIRRGYSTEQARYAINVLKAYRTSLRSGSSPGKQASAAEKLNRYRFANKKYKEKRYRFVKHSRLVWPKDALAKSRRTSEVILDNLFPARAQQWLPPLRRDYLAAEIDLENFSFLDDPVQAMSLLAEMARAEATVTHGRLNFVDKRCLDVGPFLVLQEMQRGMLPVYQGGQITKSVQSVLHFVGLRKPLGMNFPHKGGTSRLWPLPVRTRSGQNRTPTRLLAEQTSEHVAAEVIDKINEWLSVLAKLELNPNGERAILKFIGEALDNAERHSKPNSLEGAWSVAGFMSEIVSGGATNYRCHLALLSKGQTIYESISTGAEETLREIGHYTRRHTGWLRRSSLTEENLATVYALQDGVSRVEAAIRQGRGGTGFMDMFEFFASLGGTNNPDWMPSMSIVSGRTCVRLKPPYLFGQRRSQPPGEDGLLPPREIWFNQANSPSAPPDTGHVLALPAKLQGTLVTIAWTLDKEYLEQAAANRS